MNASDECVCVAIARAGIREGARGLWARGACVGGEGCALADRSWKRRNEVSLFFSLSVSLFFLATPRPKGSARREALLSVLSTGGGWARGGATEWPAMLVGSTVVLVEVRCVCRESFGLARGP